MTKKTCIKLFAVVVALAWIIVGVVLAIGVDRQLAVILLTTVALVTELALWASAALMGIAVFEARARLWARLKSRFILNK